MLILGGVVRRANLEIGLRLRERGILEAVEDVDLLSVAEMAVVAGGDGPTPETIALRRRRNLEAQQSEPLPLVWTGEPPAVSTAPVTGERFEGWSASPGRYEGRSRVIDSAATSKLRRGEVLVAVTTDASWAPLFMAAGAVVVEQGGPLSHAAIVARELGMPAVANVPGLIGRLRQEVEEPKVMVDGTEGLVVIHTDDEPGPDPAEPGQHSDDGPDSESSLDLTDFARAERSAANAMVGVVASDQGGSGASAGLAPVRELDDRWDDSSSTMNVFVAGLMGAGALMSIVIGLTESISSTRGRERLRRHAAPIASMMSEGTIHGYDQVLHRPTGLRPRSHYLVASLILFGVAAVLLATSLDSFLSEASGPVVAFALSATGVATLAAIGAVAAVAARDWPRCHPSFAVLLQGARPRRPRSGPLCRYPLAARSTSCSDSSP